MPIHVESRAAPDTASLIRQGLDLAQSNDVSTEGTTDIDMTGSWVNDTLFDGRWDSNDGYVDLTVTCIECTSKGVATVEVWEDLFDPSLKFSFKDAEFFVNVAVNISAAQWIAIDLFASQTPIGIRVPGLTVGVVFIIDLVFSLAEELDVTGGFWVKLPDDAFVEAGIFSGDIGDADFGQLPVTVDTGATTFKADLRFRVQAGVEGDTSDYGIDIGAGAVIAIYANVLEYVTVFEYDTPGCLVEAQANFNLNVGAYARLSVVIGPTVIGPTPTASTTLLAGPTLTQCLYQGGNNFTSSTVTLTSTEAAEKRAVVTAAPRAANSVYTLHRCNAAAVNCPEGFGEDVVVTKTAAVHALAATPIIAKNTFNVATGPVTLAPLATPMVGTFVPSS
ncbi:hypothetical protein SLS62_010018 [Diatrype stigma]|uniref:Uncharacterized protein n=1 Tax=Diatrype stigma TaxID=117547 RepID=A0AAN9YJL2_9PEZI